MNSKDLNIGSKITLSENDEYRIINIIKTNRKRILGMLFE